MNIDEVRTILERNFTAIGWRLDSLGVLPQGIVERDTIQGSLTCPCGGKETFTFVVYSLSGELENDRWWCHHLLATVASKQHLEQDVAEGKLPPFAIEKHIYGGTLL